MLSVPFDSPYPSTEVSLFERCGHAPSVPQQESLVIAVGGKCICMWGVCETAHLPDARRWPLVG